MNFDEIIKKCGKVVINVEEYSTITNTDSGNNKEFCLFSYRFVINKIEVLYFINEFGRWGFYKNEVTINNINANVETAESCISNSNKIDEYIFKHIKTRLSHNIRGLEQFLTNRTKKGPIFKSLYKDQRSFWLNNVLFDFVGEAGMFIVANQLSNADSRLENEITDTKSRKNDLETEENDKKNTKALFSNILSTHINAMVPFAGKVTEVDLNDAFKISFKKA